MLINPHKIEKSDIYAFDLETTGLHAWEHEIVCVSLSTATNNYVWDYRKFPKEYWDAFFKELSGKLVIAHNIKFDMEFVMYHHGIVFTKLWDTFLMDQISYNGLKYPHGLYDVVERELGVVVGNKEEKKTLQLSFTKMGDNELTDKQLKYASDDTAYLIDVYNKQHPKVTLLGLDQIRNLEDRLVPVLAKIEIGGCRVAKDRWRTEAIPKWESEKIKYEDLLDAEVTRLGTTYSKVSKRFKPRNRRTTILHDLFGNTITNTIVSPNCFNYGSSGQILELFKLLSVPIPTITEINKEGEEIVKESVGEEVLMNYLTENPTSPLEHFIRLLIDYRGYGKLISTYGDEFLNLLDKNNYIHTNYGQCRTDTGRLSSSEPNLQNLPPVIREYFIPDEGHVMITSDMSGAEVRIAADLSREEAIVNSIILDEDLHSKLASISYSIIFGEKTTISKSEDLIKGYPAKTLRDNHKSVLFAKFYKGGAKRVYGVLAEYICKFNPPHEHDNIANTISRAIDKELPALSKYLSSLIKEAKANGILRSSCLGRLRYFDTETVYGEAANFPIQGINAEAMKIALIKIDKWLSERNCGRIVLTVHDEVVCTVKKKFAEDARDFIQKTMADSLGWFLATVPGGSETIISPYWSKKKSKKKMDEELRKDLIIALEKTINKTQDGYEWRELCGLQLQLLELEPKLELRDLLGSKE